MKGSLNVCRLFVAVALACLLLACAPTDEGPARLDNYLQRLERALERELAARPLVVPPRISDAQLTQIPIASGKLGVLDFLSLSGCELQVNIGRRNSALGRNASASQRLLLDLEFLRLAPSCINQLRLDDNASLAATLEQASEQRRAALPAMIYNALMAGPEYRQLWQLPASLGKYPSEVGGDVIDTLNWFDSYSDRWLAGDYRIAPGELEQRLSSLRAGDGGALLLAAAYQQRTLDAASRSLQTRTPPLCPGGNHSRAARVTETVASKFFAADVQRWLAAVNQRRYAVMTPIERIEQRLSGVLPADYRHWADLRDSLLTQLEASPRRHVQALKQALTECPGVTWN